MVTSMIQCEEFSVAHQCVCIFAYSHSQEDTAPVEVDNDLVSDTDLLSSQRDCGIFAILIVDQMMV